MCYFYFNFWLFIVMWNENISYHVNEQGISQPSAISGLQMWMRAPKTAIQEMLPPPRWLLRSWGNARSKMDTETGFGPRQLKCIWRKWIQWAQRLTSSHTQNTNFLNLIPDLWCSDCLLPLLQTCIWPDFSPPPWSSLLRATETLSPWLRVLNVPQNKTLCFQVVTLF